MVYETIRHDERRRNAFGLLMSANMLIETPAGADSTGAECSACMREVGFRETYVDHVLGPDSMVGGVKEFARRRTAASLTRPEAPAATAWPTARASARSTRGAPGPWADKPWAPRTDWLSPWLLQHGGAYNCRPVALAQIRRRGGVRGSTGSGTT